MQDKDRVRILHMIDAAQLALQFTASRQRGDLDTDAMLRLAVVRALEIVGEAASKISPALRVQHEHIPWAAMIGMRHRLIQAYFDINTDILWNAATKEVPELLPHLRALINPDEGLECG